MYGDDVYVCGDDDVYACGDDDVYVCGDDDVYVCGDDESRSNHCCQLLGQNGQSGAR